MPIAHMKSTVVYNRHQGCLEEEKVLGAALLRFAYQSKCGKILHFGMFGLSLCSRLLGVYANSRFSRRRISGTIEELGIDLSEVEMPKDGFANFNDFFTRKLKSGVRILPDQPGLLLSPADCRMLVYPELTGDNCITVKGASFTVAELLGTEDKKLADSFRDGALCICRLCPADYHRFHFPADGEMLKTWRRRGKYHSVHPIALRQKLRIFSENVRQVSLLELRDFGQMAFVEVGAFGVASIQQTFQDTHFGRGQEKGFFAFGGSTIVMLFQPGKVRFSDDLLEKSRDNVECLVKMGEEIGRVVRGAALHDRGCSPIVPLSPTKLSPRPLVP
jgi:phosphatidylserine decarboxylase